MVHGAGVGFHEERNSPGLGGIKEGSRSRNAGGLIGEEARLRSSCGGFTAGDADYTEYGEFAERRARDEDAVGGRVQVWRGDVKAVVE